ncbi:MAG: hypothetical protein LBJ38_00720 [Oscillospiraceae bacterium]|nr:hypothetical protein [Oscillospiraceae bacterium]
MQKHFRRFGVSNCEQLVVSRPRISTTQKPKIILIAISKLMLCLILCSVLTACRRGLKSEKEATPTEKATSTSTSQEKPSSTWEPEELWNGQIKDLSETNVPPDFLTNKLYILLATAYKQLASPLGLFYDGNNCATSETDVQLWAKRLFGIDNFDYRESNKYNPETQNYEFAECPGNAVVCRSYKNKTLEKTADNQWKFSVDVFEENQPEEEPVDTGTRETYVVEGKDETFRLVSVKRQRIPEEGHTDEAKS